jgi:hypothetical protein
MSSPTFTKVASVTASTKRRPVIVDGKAGAPATNLASLKITRPVVVAEALARELRETLQLGTLVIIKQCFCQGDEDVKAGDVIVIDSVEYPIRMVNEYPFSNDVRKQIIFEDLIR